MKKGLLRMIAAVAVLLVLYCLMVFLIPFVRTGTFWISFVFTLIAFAVFGAAIYIAFAKNPDAKSKFYGFPIAKIGAIYGMAQLVAGFLFMALSQIVPVWLAVLVFAVMLGVALIGLISAEAVVEEICAQDEKLKKDVSLMRSLQSKMNQIASQSQNIALKKLAEEFRYADPVSGEAVAAAEADLSAAVDELQAAIVDSDSAAASQLCSKISALLAERNRLCKLNK